MIHITVTLPGISYKIVLSDTRPPSDTGRLIGPLPVCLVLNDDANKITGPILVWTKVLWVG